MATTTQNLGLIKPAGTDKIRIAQINSNMDTIDAKMGPVGSTPLQTQATNAASSISSLQSGLALICNGDTHAAIEVGQYAYVKNHASLSEGLYKATANIAANGTLSTSNLVAVSGGGLNAISGDTAIPISFNSGYTPSYGYARKSVNTVGINIYWSSLGKTTSWVIIGSIPSDYAPLNDIYFVDPVGISNQVMFYISRTGSIGVKAASEFSSASACAVTYVI